MTPPRQEEHPSRTSYVNLPVNEYIGSKVFAASGIPTQDVILGDYKAVPWWRAVISCTRWIRILMLLLQAAGNQHARWKQPIEGQARLGVRQPGP